MKVVLHVGAESAGSGALQRSLHLDAERLRASGIHVPMAARPVPHVAKIALGWLTPKIDQWEALATELAGLDDNIHTVVMSHESLWSQPIKALLRLRGLIGKVDLTVVMYARDQADYLSWRILEAQRHPTKRFDFNDKTQLGSFTKRMELDYLAAAQRLDRVFGSDVLEIVPEAGNALRDLDLVRDFYRRIGAEDLTPDTAALRTVTMLTPGLADALRFEPGAIPFGVAKADLLDVAMRFSSEGIGARQVLKPNQVARIRSRYQVSNSQLSTMFLGGEEITVAKPDTNLADHRSTEELRQLLFDHLEVAPLLKGDWLASPQPDQRPFAQGWVLREAAPMVASPLIACLRQEMGRLRFRVPFGFEQRADDHGVQLCIEPETPGLHPCHVLVNGRDLGIIDLGATHSVSLGHDTSGLGVFDVELRPITADPFEVSSVQVGDRTRVSA